MKLDKLFIVCVNQKNYKKKYTITNLINTNKSIIQKEDTIFMNSESSKASILHVLILKLTDKLDLRRGKKSIALSNASITIYGKA